MPAILVEGKSRFCKWETRQQVFCSASRRKKMKIILGECGIVYVYFVKILEQPDPVCPKTVPLQHALRSSQGHSYGPQGAWEHSTYSLSSSYHSLGGRPRCVFLRIRAMLLFAPLLYCGLGMAADLYGQNTKSAPIS